MQKKKFEPSQPYELFILALSLLSIFNILLYFFPFTDASKTVVQVVDFVLCMIFMVDFLFRLKNAESKKGYFIGERGWLDLLGSIPAPGLRVFRMFRILRSIHTMRKYGLGHMITAVRKEKAQSALFVVVFCIMLVLEFGSIAVLQTEANSPNSNIHTASDALWWTYVTITTVGYGDRFPVTNAGRVVGILVLTTGVGLFGVLTGFLANAFLKPAPELEEPEGEEVSAIADPDAKEILRRLDALTRKVDALSSGK